MLTNGTTPRTERAAQPLSGGLAVAAQHLPEMVTKLVAVPFGNSELPASNRPNVARMNFAELAPGVIARARHGDEEAFHVIFTRYGRPVLSFIQQQLQNRELAEELTQETFVRAYRNLAALQDDTRLSTWLFGIARNVVRESIRRKYKDEKNVPLDTPESLQLPASGQLAEGTMLDRELQAAIARALGELDEDKRAVFSLKVFHEKSYEEISAITGHSIGKLKTDLHRARLEIRKRIAPYLPNPSST